MKAFSQSRSASPPSNKSSLCQVDIRQTPFLIHRHQNSWKYEQVWLISLRRDELIPEYKGRLINNPINANTSFRRETRVWYLIEARNTLDKMYHDKKKTQQIKNKETWTQHKPHTKHFCKTRLCKQSHCSDRRKTGSQIVLLISSNIRYLESFSHNQRMLTAKVWFFFSCVSWSSLSLCIRLYLLELKILKRKWTRTHSKENENKT